MGEAQRTSKMLPSVSVRIGTQKADCRGVCHTSYVIKVSILSQSAVLPQAVSPVRSFYKLVKQLALNVLEALCVKCRDS